MIIPTLERLYETGATGLPGTTKAAPIFRLTAMLAVRLRVRSVDLLMNNLLQYRVFF